MMHIPGVTRHRHMTAVLLFVVVTSLPGCVSQGETREQAVENIREAIQLYIEALEEDGLPVPEERLDALLVAV